MGSEPLDKIHIIDLMLRCAIGVTEEERREKQDVIINITFHTDLRAAGESDNLADTVDYKTAKKRVISLVENSRYNLVERLAEKIAALCLESAAIQRVTVRVEKPGALRFARSVGVEIVRERK